MFNADDGVHLPAGVLLPTCEIHPQNAFVSLAGLVYERRKRHVERAVHFPDRLTQLDKPPLH